MMTTRPIALLGMLLSVWALLTLTACGAAPATATTEPEQSLSPTATTVALAPGEETSVPDAPATESLSVSQEDEPVYLDDRSNPEALMRSFVNALNLRQYSRAYSYWEEAFRPFEYFKEGYADTQSVEMVMGEIGQDAGAGQRYYSVPVILTAQTSTGTQYFVGCYVLHLSHPDLQAEPPFRPLAIRSAEVEQVESEAEAQARLPQICATP